MPRNNASAFFRGSTAGIATNLTTPPIQPKIPLSPSLLIDRPTISTLESDGKLLNKKRRREIEADKELMEERKSYKIEGIKGTTRSFYLKLPEHRLNDLMRTPDQYDWIKTLSQRKLVDHLTHCNPVARQIICYHLSGLLFLGQKPINDCQAQKAFNALLKTLQEDQDPGVRCSAVSALNGLHDQLVKFPIATDHVSSQSAMLMAALEQAMNKDPGPTLQKKVLGVPGLLARMLSRSDNDQRKIVTDFLFKILKKDENQAACMDCLQLFEKLNTLASDWVNSNKQINTLSIVYYSILQESKFKCVREQSADLLTKLVKHGCQRGAFIDRLLKSLEEDKHKRRWLTMNYRLLVQLLSQCGPNQRKVVAERLSESLRDRNEAELSHASYKLVAWLLLRRKADSLNALLDTWACEKDFDLLSNLEVWEAGFEKARQALPACLKHLADTNPEIGVLSGVRRVAQTDHMASQVAMEIDDPEPRCHSPSPS